MLVLYFYFAPNSKACYTYFVGYIKEKIRRIKLRWHLYWMAVDNRPLLERLNDYDDNGIPYWEKWNKDEKHN